MAASLITVLFLFVCQLQSASAEPQRRPIKEITAQPGDDVILPCPAPNNVTTLIVEWSRSDLKGSVCVFQGRQLIPEYQDPSYVNRVQLKDDEMKNGELSLILKNVNNKDEGRYECVYVEKSGGRRKRLGDINFNFQLNVKDLQKPPPLKHITAHPGEDVTLPCHALNYINITAVSWIRSDLNGFVCTFEARQKIPKQEHHDYVNRVQLEDDKMKNGELSLNLKNVKSNDDGTYVCLYEGMKGTDQIKFISIVHLSIKDGNSWGTLLGLGLTIAALALGIVGYMCYCCIE